MTAPNSMHRLLVGWGAALLLTTLPASAATLTVTKTADTDDGVCNADCSLREAIATASDGDVIVFSALFNTPQTITLTTGTALSVSVEVSIIGPGAELLTVVGAGGAFPPDVFRIFPGAFNDVSLSGMTITGGRMGVYNSNADLVIDRCVITGNSDVGFYNAGDAVVTGSTISENIGDDRGGGIENHHFLSITSSTIANNTTTGFFTYAGGIYHRSDNGVLTIDNSTISGNTGDEVGGVYADGETFITNTTITNNSGPQAGGLLVLGPVTVASTIIAGNVNNTVTPDVERSTSSITSNGYNLIGNVGSVTAFAFLGDQTGTGAAVLDPLLFPLANNGGETMTHRLMSGSPAIDKANSQGAVVDQRGYTRPFDHAGIATPTGGNESDIGAFEAQLLLSVAGRAIAFNGAILAGTRITLRPLASGPTKTAKVNLKGLFTLGKVATNAKYIVTAVKDGYRFAPQIIEVGEKAISDLTFVGTPVR